MALVGLVAAGVLASAGGLAHAAEARSAQQGTQSASAGVDLDGASPGLAVARAALVDLRLQREVRVHDYEIAQQLLGLAQSLAPGEGEVLRKRIEAATGAGRDGLVDRLTRELVALDPGDTVAQLRLITSQLDARQTAGERLEVYRRLLGPRGGQLDASLRSRLALDAALLARELGNDEEFASLLTTAATLDMTNKEAASLALSFFGERVDDPVGRADLIINLLLSDPLDPNVMWMLYEHTLAYGAFDAAFRLSNLMSTLLARDNQPPDPALANDRVVLVWWQLGPERVVEQLNQQLLGERYTAEQQRAFAEREGLPTEDIPLPSEVHLPIESEQARIFAAVTIGDEQTLDAATADLIASSGRRVEEINERQRGADPLPAERARLASLTILYERFALQGLTRRQPEELDAGLSALRGSLASSPMLLRVCEMWADVANGRPEAAIERAEGVRISSIPPLGMVALIEAMFDAGRSAEASELAARLARAQPSAAAGAWAWWKHQRAVLEANPDATLETLFPETNAIRGRVLSLPAWLEEMIAEPREFLALAVELVEPTIGPLGEARVRVRVRNTSRIPLSVGGSRPIDSSVLVSPRLTVGSDDADIIEAPEVLVLSRKLRLMPREELVAEVWADAGYTGWYAQIAALKTIRARWRVFQGFRYDGVYSVGPYGVTADSDVLVRRRFVDSEASPSEIASRIRGGDAGDVAEMVGLVRALVAERGATFELGEVGEALAAVYPTLGRGARAFVLATMPHAQQVPSMEAFDRAVLDGEMDAGLMGLALATRVRAVDDPALERAASMGDGAGDGAGAGTLADMVAAIRARLAGDEPAGLAHIGPGFEGAFREVATLE